MRRHRVIPSLLLSKGGLVKTTRFARPSYVGDPINAVRIFNEKEVDELIVLDIDASGERRGPDFATAEQLADECFMPLCWGGGVRSVDDAMTLFALGIEKVAVRSAGLADPALYRRIADRAGEQAVVVAVDVERTMFGGRRVRDGLGAKSRRDWRDVLRDGAANGAGEALVMAVDRDGMRAGMDLDLVREAAGVVDIPLIAAGGIGSLGDVRAAIDAGADAVAAGAWCVWQGPQKGVLITYPTPAQMRDLWSSGA